MRIRFSCLVMLLAFLACESNKEKDYHLPKVPAGFPLPDSIRRLDEKAEAQAVLGRSLFYDKRLSVSNNFSCASCHLPAQAFSGGIDRNVGENQGRARRNTPALFNLWHHQAFFHDGGIPRLAEVSLAPMDNRHELNLPIDTLVRKLWSIPSYVQAFYEVYGEDPSPYTVTRALMWFQLTLVSADSRFDRWYFEKKNELSPQEIRGFNLFMSDRTQCGSCHMPPLFTDGQFHHIGYANRHEPDTGRARISMLKTDEGKFRTPSLRNLAFTAPYMHDGGIKTLVEVIDHYSEGGVKHPNKDTRIKALHLSAREKDDLLAFLHSLTDSNFVAHPHYLPSGYSD